MARIDDLQKRRFSNLSEWLMSRRIKTWTIVGGLLGLSFGAIPVVVAEMQFDQIVSVPVLFALWPASGLCCAGIGAGAALLLDRIEEATSARLESNGESNIAGNPSSSPS
jgi:hypothetical protein